MSTKALQGDTVGDEMIMNRIYVLRGKKVMIDEDLCRLYRVGHTRIKKLVGRYPACFPLDFMFQLSKEEFVSLASQDQTVKRKESTGDYPLAFTEQGLSMLAGMIRSSRTVMINIRIIRIFSMIRHVVLDYPELNNDLGKFTLQRKPGK
jgi:hypothetical protein